MGVGVGAVAGAVAGRCVGVTKDYKAISVMNRSGNMLTTHNQVSIANKPVPRRVRLIGRHVGIPKDLYCRGCLLFRHNYRSGADNSDSGEEGNGDDNPISLEDPATSTIGNPAPMAVGGEDGERLHAN